MVKKTPAERKDALIKRMNDTMDRAGRSMWRHALVEAALASVRETRTLDLHELIERLQDMEKRAAMVTTDDGLTMRITRTMADEAIKRLSEAAGLDQKDENEG